MSVATDGSEAQTIAKLCEGGFQFGSFHEVLSSDGEHVAFASMASNLAPDDTNFTGTVRARRSPTVSPNASA